MNTFEKLEAWQDAEKSRSVSIGRDDGYGTSCWCVELRRGKQAVCCTETSFTHSEGIDPTWYEEDDNLYCCVVEGDTWPGLEKTILHAIECADKFFKVDSLGGGE